MTQEMEYNDKTGYNAIDSLRKNLLGILDEIHAMKKYKLDTSKLELRLKEFEEKFKIKDSDLKNTKMPFEEMQRDMEVFVLGDLVKELQSITDDYRKDIAPLYKIYTLFTEIDEAINNIGDINRVIELSKTLIDSINEINTHNSVESTTLINAAYNIIFNALQYETVYEKDELLQYVIILNMSSNKENQAQC